MDKSLFKKYIDEMKDMQKRSRLPREIDVVSGGAEREDATELVPNYSEPASDYEEQSTAEMTGEGFLLVDVTSVRELYPLQGAKITVFTGDADNRTVFAEGVTDISGKAGPFALSAPAIKYSEEANSEILPFAYYNILTEADGFVDTIHLGVQIFDKVTSIQKVNLLPFLDNGNNSTVIINEFTERQGI